MAKMNFDDFKTMGNRGSVTSKVAIKDMTPSKENTYSISNIEMLADTISEDGLYQNFVLMETKEDRQKYIILGGHRRYYAIKYNIENGIGSENDKYSAIIKPYMEDELDRKYAMVMINTYRDKTDDEKVLEYETIKAKYERDAKNGIKLKGRKIDYIAKDLHLSKSMVGQIANVQHNAIEEIKEKAKTPLEEGGLSITIANEVAKLEPEEQKNFVELQNAEAREKIKKHKEKKNKEKESVKNVAENTALSKEENEPEAEQKPAPKKEYLTNEEFLKCFTYVVERKIDKLNEETISQLNAIKLTLENLLHKDIDTILDNIE